ncbi:hypothetical protein GTP91_26195, partial [Rugamonas sp. FT82W]|nr:hypothetical protein [Duganella vulcania]
VRMVPFASISERLVRAAAQSAGARPQRPARKLDLVAEGAPDETKFTRF